jgi:hypothetical protein
MPRLNYVGPVPTDDGDVLNRLQGTDLINAATVNRVATTSTIEAAAASKASKEAIDTADAAYSTAQYYQGRDALNVTAASVGAANGVAGLVSGTVPLAQLPVLGQGFLKGPFGPTTVNIVTNATTTPVKLAEFAIGVQSVAFHPLAYATAAVNTTPGGRPVLEMRISDGAAAYADQTLIAQGVGRSIYNGRQIVSVTPAAAMTGVSNPAPLSVSTNIVVSLWVYSTTTTPVSVSSSSLISAVVYLMRMQS